MFEAKLEKAGLLKKIIDAVKDLVSDAPFDCSENAFCLQAMDSSHVALVSLKMETGLFETYRCDRTINLGIHMDNMAKAFKCANNDDTCQIRYSGDGDDIEFAFEDIKRDRTQTVSVKLMDIDTEHLGIPDQEYSCKITMPSHEFQKVCRDLALFSDTLSVACTKGQVTFRGEGDNGSNTVVYEPSASADNEEERVVIELDDPVAVTFSIKYMNHFTKASNLSSTVKLSLSNDVPIVVEYAIEEDGYLRFYLAPKIGENEDAEKMEDADR